MSRLAEKVAVITGGGSGMGQAWARRLATAGATVAILDVNEAGMAETAACCSQHQTLCSRHYRCRRGCRCICRH